MLIAMGLAALAQSGANKGAAGQHGFNASLNQSHDTRAPDLETGNFGTYDVNKSISKYGTKYDEKTGKFTLPNGKSFSMNDLSNAEAMANAGVSPDEYKKAMAMAKDAEKKAVADSNKLVSTENGYASSGGSFTPPPTVVTEGEENGLQRGLGPREPASVAGMVRNYNGDMIGVAGDDIFSMMARRYREKTNKDAFLAPESKPEETSAMSGSLNY